MLDSVANESTPAAASPRSQRPLRTRLLTYASAMTRLKRALVLALQAGGKTDAAIAFAAVFGSAQEKGA
jgi:hypothetical protein